MIARDQACEAARPGSGRSALARRSATWSAGWARHWAAARACSGTLRAAFNPHWESLFREGRAASRFGQQVMEFACIYTSRVSNFLGYPADKFFSRPLEVLPHERWALPET